MKPLSSHFSKNPITRLLPAFLMMLAIFLFSARPSEGLPFSWFDHVVNKGGHVIGYAMLAMAYWRALDFKDRRRWFVWLLAVLYAVTDEYHQSFVAGRHGTALDVLVYDNFGALISLWVANVYVKQKQPNQENPVAEKVVTNR